MYQCWSISKDLFTSAQYEDLPGVVDNRDGWQERVRKLCAVSMT